MSELKIYLQFAGFCFFGLYALSLLFSTMAHISSATYNQTSRYKVCHLQYRYEYIFPARAMACYLSEKVGE